MRDREPLESLGLPKSQEIERKFLVEGGFDIELFAHNAVRIRQGYLSVGEDGSEDRVRESTDARGITAYTRTQKEGQGLVRGEIEVYITAGEFADLWGQTEGARVEKARYIIPYEGCVIEYDVYSGDLRGLKVAEVEFTNEEESEKFEPPEWFGREVTQDAEYKNQSLATRGTPQNK